MTVSSPFNPVFAALPVTVFERMSRIARDTGAINLGQGFPDEPGPESIRRKAAEAVVHGLSQYPPMMGIPELRAAIASHYARWQGVTLDPAEEVMVTSGATEAIAAALFALLSEGDEAVLIQPMYDAYLPLVRRAGGAPRFVRLAPPDWRLEPEALKAAITPRTKVVVLNNPLNPTGSAYGRADLEALAEAMAGTDAVLVSDEVWEHVTFDGREHVTALSVPALRDRTVKIGSAGKMFALTGWKIGLVCAAPHLMRALARSHQFLTFTTPPSLQAAVAYGLEREDAWFAPMRADLQRKRDLFSDGLRAAGFTPLDTAGAYFLNVDLAPLGVDDDLAFCDRLAFEAGVVSVPVSAFYEENPVRSVARFCFAKHDRTLLDALERLARFRP
ncbi:aspartate/methionine/tyrosine aminotransferase [Methylopila jiangsuensis]|uniref:aminotransferase n=1 Tax=Methylopila jiangsuensis TaxID=586230 RepID=UPI0022F2EA3F|nr:aminotransferase [Methylopila jiangsuensis]MDR6286207.1 aspartate/methionine/tyrosine aminotransferase [Methylopila jiangsuensis]